MDISALNTDPLSQSSYSKQTDNKTGIDTFLTMLVAQLKNQDPLNPMEGTEFAVQLAQFSTLEQQFKTNDYLESIQSALQTKEAGDLFDYIGKTIKTNNDSVYVQNGVVGDITYTLNDRADVSVAIYNSEGSVVKRIYEGWKSSGSHVLKWDGKDETGKSVEDGVYTFAMNGVNEQGGYVSLETYTTGEISGVSYKGGIPYLMIGDQAILPSKVVEVSVKEQENENK